MQVTDSIGLGPQLQMTLAAVRQLPPYSGHRTLYGSRHTRAPHAPKPASQGKGPRYLTVACLEPGWRSVWYRPRHDAVAA
jgi:hypothetical protein